MRNATREAADQAREAKREATVRITMPTRKRRLRP
jgi:hypothetical protein